MRMTISAADAVRMRGIAMVCKSFERQRGLAATAVTGSTPVKGKVIGSTPIPLGFISRTEQPPVLGFNPPRIGGYGRGSLRFTLTGVVK